MATKFSFVALIFLLSFSIAAAVNGLGLPPKFFDATKYKSIAAAANGRGLLPKFFDVTKYGAVADGKTENNHAFLRAWRDACNYPGRSRVWIPKGIYKLGTVRFTGPCKGPIAFLIKGTLKAPINPSEFNTDTWIGFRYVDFLTVKGGGTLDGQGSAAWKYNDCQINPRCMALPASLRFDFIKHSSVRRIRSINSKNLHINLFACNKMDISDIRLTAPANSPNTDGIHIGSSTDIKISRTIISTGDDCISMVSGSQNIDISDVVCGPGHGISIGSLGRSHSREYVLGISVSRCTFIGTDNGVRIKTWGASSLQSLASNITFQDIVMKNVQNPIIIDQQYCPSQRCLSGDSAVQVEDVVFKNIWGTSDTKVALMLRCSGAVPCKNVELIDIDLTYRGRDGLATAMCSNVRGSSYGRQMPAGCL